MITNYMVKILHQAWAMVNFFNNGGITIKFKKEPLSLPLIISKEKNLMGELPLITIRKKPLTIKTKIEAL